jgi:asparagine synthase (glutamine-hydrolysing)
MKLYKNSNTKLALTFSNYQYYKRNDKDYYIKGNSNNIPIEKFLSEKYNELEIGWGLVIVDTNELIIVSDKLRTFPFFYKTGKNTIEVTDNCNRIISDEDTIDEYSSFEYKAAGFVRGNRTLYNNIFQTEAGSIVEISLSNSNTINLKSYFDYYNSDSIIIQPNLLLTELEIVTQKLIDEIKSKYYNRRIIIPLSSGLDSRYVAYLVKKSGIEDVLCFTYGKENFKEVVKAKDIAKKIELNWVHVPYSRKTWRETKQNKLFINYLYNDSWIGSLAHIQDWPAIHWLIENGYVNSDSIIMPGHTGDFISGGHIPVVLQKEDSTVTELLEALLEKHFRVHRPNLNDENSIRLKRELLKNILSLGKGNKNPYNNSRYIEHFDWKERQSKFIVNSIQVYNSFNLDWYLPLWSNLQIEFWSKVPIDYKFDKKLYIKYLGKITEYGIFNDVNFEKKESTHIKNVSKLRLIKRRIYSKILILRKQYLDYYFDGYGWYGLFSYLKVVRKYKFQNINSFLVDKILDEKNNKKYNIDT